MVGGLFTEVRILHTQTPVVCIDKGWSPNTVSPNGILITHTGIEHYVIKLLNDTVKANNYSYTTPKAPCDTPEAQRQGDVEYTSHWSAIPFQQHDTSPHISYTKVSGDLTFCSLRELAEVRCSQSSQRTHTQTYSVRPPARTGQLVLTSNTKKVKASA